MAKKVTIEGTKLMFRNFAGAKTQYNREGDRNFHVVIDKDTADKMDKDDWFIKINEPKNEGDEVKYTVKVRIGENDEPSVYVIGENKKPVRFNKGQFKRIDRLNIVDVDVVFHQAASTFEYHGREYHSAYLDKIFINILEDDLDKKYGIYDESPDPEEEGNY